MMSRTVCRAFNASAHSERRVLYSESTRLCLTLLFVMMILESVNTTGAYSKLRSAVSKKMALSFLPLATANWSMMPQLQPLKLFSEYWP